MNQLLDCPFKKLEPWSSDYGRKLMFQRKVVGSNPRTIYWMDIFSHLFVAKIVCLFEKTKIKKKVANSDSLYFAEA